MSTDRVVILTLTVLLVFSAFAPPAAGADEVEFRGKVVSKPDSGLLGIWTVSRYRVRVGSRTEIDTEKGAPSVGATVEIKGERRDSVVIAKEFKVLQPASGGDSSTGGTPAADGWKIIGWNDLGMHCMDGKDFSVFTMLPPANTIHAHVITPSGGLISDSTGVTLTYEAVADPTGSVNTTSAGKTNFWDYVLDLFGAPLTVDQGLAGSNMPGAANVPQPMKFEADHNWFTGEFIPISPYDDAGKKNYYPLMRIRATNSSGQLLASTDVVLPVSDEMDCRSCHASGSVSAARPADGWVFNTTDSEKDYKLNILKLHDERNRTNPAYGLALSEKGYNAGGLLATVETDKTPILCANCHPTNALPVPGIATIKPLTQALHGLHAGVRFNGIPLNDENNRTACYSCHPGAETRCLRGAMGAAVSADGSMAMQCQSCHGSMSQVGSPARNGWFDEPRCESCHSGTATQNNGQIRYTSVFEPSGAERDAVDATFAVNTGKLYRFSAGHGGLQCSGCHGSTHAIYASSHENDNLQNIALQGHEGTLAECTACHATMPRTIRGGPHGMHPIGPDWLDRHKDAAEGGGQRQCQSCHGVDYRGTELSRALGDRTLRTEFGTKVFWKGFQIGCYACHNGPSNEGANRNRPPSVSNASLTTTEGMPKSILLIASDPDGNPLTLRIVSQPANGTVALSGSTAIFHPHPSFTGTDTFTFAAWDGSTNSNLGTVSVAVN